ncbi:hypothetical protein C2R22_24035 (plasmid) [Salinigranum rubrum]|uniref:Uncharacterized protein n=1 Tax=Salinigranum rubrum TaxID=755307 RepID=A0A2I8VTV5_9EURY|nr:hypothetical protein C2R22_24035 [Salinigranum rubrum]
MLWPDCITCTASKVDFSESTTIWSEIALIQPHNRKLLGDVVGRCTLDVFTDVLMLDLCDNSLS